MSEEKVQSVLVETQWVANRLSDPKVRLVEVDVDTAAYDQGHIPGAVGWNWQSQLQDQVRRDILSQTDFERLMSGSGISPDTTVIVYGDNSNWFAAYALWQMKLYRHPDVRLMDGGRKKWVDEGRPVTTEKPNFPQTSYYSPGADETLRARRSLVEESLGKKDQIVLVDVRSPDEYFGRIIAPPGLNETAQRPGHIPGAKNIPWGQAVREDGTFRSVEELKKLYGDKGITPDRDVIAYCRIGERSSHTWFVLKYLLGFENVRNYDGSWTEWGNLVDAPVALEEE